MIYERTEKPITDTLTKDIEYHLRDLWFYNPHGFMDFVNNLIGEKFFVHPGLWIHGLYEARDRLSSKERMSTLCFSNVSFNLFILADQEQVRNEKALREYITFFASCTSTHPILMIFSDDEYYDSVISNIGNTKRDISRPVNEYDIFVVKISHWKRLLKKSDDNECMDGGQMTEKDSRSLDIARQLFKHIEDGTLTEEILDEALSQDIDVDLCTNMCGWTLLMEVCSNPICTPQMVEKLIKAGADVNFEEEYLKNTALFYTDTEKAKILLKYGANVNHKNSFGDNALVGRAHLYPDMIKLLVENGIDVNNQNRYGENALFRLPKCDVVRVLVENGLNIHDTNDDGENIIDLICMSVDVESLKFLLKKGVKIKPESGLAQIVCDDELVQMVRERIGEINDGKN